MIRVMVVEDEPAAMKYIAALIRERCHGLEIVFQAEDGGDAIDFLRGGNADIVVTDVQMARTNGIELVRWIRAERPEILTVIVSGHSDFEYAKGAIQAGVAEYLLKPINPFDFSAVMDRLKIQALEKHRIERENWLRRAMSGRADFSFWPWPCHTLRLAALYLGGEIEPREHFAVPPDAPDALTVVGGPGGRAVMLAFPAEVAAETERIVSAVASHASYFSASLCLVERRGADNLEKLPRSAELLAVPGLNQIREYAESPLKEPDAPKGEQELMKKLHYAISGALLGEIKSGLVALFSFWEEKDVRLVSVEMSLLRLLQDITEHAPPGHGMSRRDVSEHADHICRTATCFPDMLRQTWAFCETQFSMARRRSESVLLIGDIEMYIREHLGEHLSTQSVCAVFGISGSYLSQLFRKHLKTSFVEFVTQLRIEEAKRMIATLPDISIKDIAASLGFSDQFYFSKVFRSITGVPPSEYRDSVGFSI